MKKSTAIKLRKLANLLPLEMHIVNGREKIIGSDISLTGIKPDYEIDPEKEYLITSPEYHQNNHYLRLKKAYNKYGARGVAMYFKKYSPKYWKTVIAYLS